jgi:eukaryotic-like serine/threonine-protein kinase
MKASAMNEPPEAADPTLPSADVAVGIPAQAPGPGPSTRTESVADPGSAAEASRSPPGSPGTKSSPQRTDCLTEDEILEYRCGQASAQLLGAIDVHLDGCRPCQQLVDWVVRDELDPNPHPSQLTTFHDGSIVANRYRIESFIGKGGMGEVYAAEDRLTRRRVALKTVLCTAADDPRAIRTLLGEVANAQRVAHPHVFKIYDLHEHREPGHGLTPFFTMEFIEGESLGKRLRRDGTLPIDESRRIARQLLAGLGAAHDKGVLHLDLKSDNVMLRRGGREPEAVIMDFGLSRIAGQDAKQRTSERMHGGGTLRYMAIEQLECRRNVGAPADVYAFGVVLYEMLTGATPFRGDSIGAMLLKQVTERPAPPSCQVPALSSSVDAFVLDCLQRNPADRFAHAGLALAAFDAIPSWAESTRPGELISNGSNAPVAAPVRPARRTSARVGSALKVVAVALVAGLLSWGSRNDDRIPDERTSETAAAASKVPTPVTELPLPVSESAEALVAYKAALQGIRDGNWGYVESHLERALALDPGLAIAHLRMAMVQHDSPMMEPRAQFALALAGRASLSERDLTLLHVFEPVMYRDPPDSNEHVARLRAATERFSGDAEFFGISSWVLREPEEKLAAARRAVELDPHYADGWQGVGASLFELGRTDEALAALDRCVAISPATADCSGQRGFLHASEGRCTEMDEDFRRAVGISANGLWQDGRAFALFASGGSAEAVVEVFRSKWAQLGEDQKAAAESLDRAALAIAMGHFEAAEHDALAAHDIVSSSDEALTHLRVALLLVDIYAETSRPKEAARVAHDYLKRKDAWIRSHRSDEDSISMYWAMFRAKSMSREAFLKKRDAWARAHASDARSISPLSSYAGGVETAEEAREALALFPNIKPPPVIWDKGMGLPMLGKLYTLAGRASEAVPMLERTVKSCYALMAPLVHTRASLHLGQALEASDDRQGACAAYASVLARWGNAKPPSVTATKARDRSRALRCKAATTTLRAG